MPSRRSAQLTVVRPNEFQRQTAFDAPVAQAEMTSAINVTSRNYIDLDETVEDIYDCTGEDYLFELLTGRFARLILEMDVDPDELAGWVALAYGTAAAPSGGTNEVQTFSQAGGTAGTFQLRFTRDYNSQTTAAIAYNAAAAAIQAALEALTNIGAGNVLVAGGPMGTAPITVTFQGALANMNVGMLEVLNAITAGVITGPAETVAGVGRTHDIDRIAPGLYTLPYTTLYVGHRGSSEQPVIFKNVVVNSVRVRSTSREKVTATVELIGSGDLAQSVGFTIPACTDIEPIRFGDCSLLVNAQELYSGASTYGVENNGIAVARDWEFFYQNDILTGNHAFTGQGVDVTRLERADRRPSGITFGALGEPHDTLFEQARSRSIVPITLRVGPTHNNVTFIMPQALLKLDNPRIRHEGDANESHIRLVGRPKKVSGDAATPSNVTAVTNQAVAYLVAA